MALPNPLRVLFLCSEADPLIKVGGLGDVGGSLPPALRSLKSFRKADDAEQPVEIDVRLVLPFHGAIAREIYQPEKVASFQVAHKSGPIPASAYQLELNRVPVYLIAGDPIDPQASVYSSDWGFDAHKYIFFSLAALELARQIGFQPHIVHSNDWHTAAAVYWLWLHRDSDPFFQNACTLLSVHNLPFMGIGGSFPMDSFYLPPAPEGILPEWAMQLPLPLGLLSADWINTVSPTYAREILTPEFGAGLESFLKTRSGSISGILNGIDPERWNPASDPYLAVPFSLKNFSKRAENKRALLGEVGFEETGQGDQVPLFAMITRMDYQKGVDLAVDALRELGRRSDYPWRALFLGTGLPELEEMVLELQEDYPEQVRAVLKFDAPLSHRIYAGADALLMPSRYEPCGLAQMIAMRYGCVPIARATGGLADTVVDVDASPKSTGFLFNEASPKALFNTLIRAIKLYPNQEAWQALQRRGMRQDFSWRRSALEYLKIYESLISASHKGKGKGKV